MRALLDTHALLWYTLGSSQLSATARNTIIDASNEILISPASYWEIAIKVSLGKYILHVSYDVFMDSCIQKYGFDILPIEPRHTSRVATLPHFKDHKDPFDRLLVAQALVDNIRIISIDEKLDQYGASRLW